MIKCIDKLNSFNDFYEITKNMKAKEKGDLFEEFTKYIFMFHNDYSDSTKEIWLLKDVPLNILTKLNLPVKDYGIDLILLTTDGKLRPIQCKFRANANTVIDWKELSTFFGLAYGVADGFDKGYFVTNTYNIIKNAKRSNLVISIYDTFFDDKDNKNKNMETFIIKLKAYLKPNINIIPRVRTPWPHQQEIITKTIDHFEENDRGNVIMACGTGKTLTSYWIDKGMHNSVVIVAVPSLYLLSQMYNDWHSQMIDEKRKYHFILVGSDADYDEAKCDYKNLLLTTDTDEIANKLRDIIKPPRHLKISILCTYQSSDKLISALKQTNITPKLCIFDEAHKTVGQKDKQFSLLMDDNNIEIKKRLFMTATQRYYNGNDESILSMDDEQMYGKKIATFNTSSAIKNGLLVDYQIVMMYINDEYVEKFVKENKFAWYNNKLYDAQQLATGIMLIKEFQQGNCNHLLTYHNSIKSSKNFRELLETLIKSLKLDINVFDIDGTYTMSMRNRIFRGFTNAKNAIIVSAMVLNEGVNIPIIDSVCFVDPRMSIINIIQCAGRAFRLFLEKLLAKIYIPIVLNGDVDVENDNIFGNIVTVLRALSTTDDDIVEYFSALKTGKVVNRKIIRHVAYIEKNNTIEKIGEIVDIDDWMKGIELKVWEKLDPWINTYNDVKLWVENNKNNKLPSEKSKNPIEKKFGLWCGNQRQNGKINKLSAEKVTKLELIHNWYWLPKDLVTPPPKSFDIRYEEVKLWIMNNNGKFPVKNNKNKDIIEHTNALWCYNKRDDKKTGLLSDEQIIKLETIPGWTWDMNDKFYINYNRLIKWKKSHDDKLPTYIMRDDEEAKYLENWCAKIREKKRKGTLSDEQIKKMEELGPKWIWSNNDNYDMIYNNLLLWMNDNENKIPSTESNDPKEKRLAQWYRAERYRRKTGKLPEHKNQKIDYILSIKKP